MASYRIETTPHALMWVGGTRALRGNLQEVDCGPYWKCVCGNWWTFATAIDWCEERDNHLPEVERAHAEHVASVTGD